MRSPSLTLPHSTFGRFFIEPHQPGGDLSTVLVGTPGQAIIQNLLTRRGQGIAYPFPLQYILVKHLCERHRVSIFNRLPGTDVVRDPTLEKGLCQAG